MAAVVVLWARNLAPWAEATLASVHAQLPACLLERMPRYRRWQDRQQGLLGKLLLRAALQHRGIAADLAAMTWSAKGRPALPGVPDFNITHCDGLVACALGDGPRVGVDVERVRPIPLADLERVLTNGERQAIAQAADPARELCRIWTFKEAVVKADGKGVGLDLQRVDSLAATVEVAGTRWHVQPLTIDPAFACHLACETQADVELLEDAGVWDSRFGKT